MKNIFTIIILSALFAGCAGVKVYSDETLQKRTGIKVYSPKPFLLVEYNLSSEVPIKSTVIYLPDMNNPVYVKTINGLGSNDFSFDANENGTIKTYGVNTDSKIPETIEKVGGILTDVGSLITSLAKNQADSATVALRKASPPSFQLFEIVFTKEGVLLKELDIKASAVNVKK